EATDSYLGLTGPVDHKRALKLFRLSAAKGHPLAPAEVGGMVAQGQGCDADEAEGERLIRSAMPAVRRLAEAGNSYAQDLLGVAMAVGLGIERDEKEALRWHRLAAAQGNGCAMYNLAVMYQAGRGVETDVKESLEWYKKS